MGKEAHSQKVMLSFPNPPRNELVETEIISSVLDAKVHILVVDEKEFKIKRQHLLGYYQCGFVLFIIVPRYLMIHVSSITNKYLGHGSVVSRHPLYHLRRYAVFCHI